MSEVADINRTFAEQVAKARRYPGGAQEREPLDLALDPIWPTEAEVAAMPSHEFAALLERARAAYPAPLMDGPADAGRT